MTLYLEQYLDTLQDLPADLRRNLELLAEWDADSQSKLRQLDKLIKAFATGCRDSGRTGWSKETRQKKYQEIKDLFKQCHTDGENKVSVANQTYELVDKHIRKLDADLARFEADVKRRFLGSIASDSEAESVKGRKKKEKDDGKKVGSRKRKNADADATTSAGDKKGRKKGAQKEVASPRSPTPPPVGNLDAEQLASLTGPALFQQLAGGSADVMDMPVDPNEPTYCLCHQVSYGEMVGCDNSDCPIEWFHFACVNLTSKPKGKWYCPRCTEERKKKNQK